MRGGGKIVFADGGSEGSVDVCGGRTGADEDLPACRFCGQGGAVAEQHESRRMGLKRERGVYREHREVQAAGETGLRSPVEAKYLHAVFAAADGCGAAGGSGGAGATAAT